MKNLFSNSFDVLYKVNNPYTNLPTGYEYGTSMELVEISLPKVD